MEVQFVYICRFPCVCLVCPHRSGSAPLRQPLRPLSLPSLSFQGLYAIFSFCSFIFSSLRNNCHNICLRDRSATSMPNDWNVYNIYANLSRTRPKYLPRRNMTFKRATYSHFKRIERRCILMNPYFSWHLRTSIYFIIRREVIHYSPSFGCMD